MSPFPDTRLMLNLFVWLWTWPVSSMMVPGTSGCRGRSIGTSGSNVTKLGSGYGGREQNASSLPVIRE
uniref:Putative secreted protein n=1 Tax=Ixodes ricinus TaxID=34613 RepID=A0A6B0U0L6_IXORI